VAGASPIALFLREHADAWRSVVSDAPARRGASPNAVVSAIASGFSRTGTAAPCGDSDAEISDAARRVLECLRSRGASFGHELASACGLAEREVRDALAELVAAGEVSSDGFAGLRAIIGGARASGSDRRRIDSAGRWFVVERGEADAGESAVEAAAWGLLRRYGVMFRRLLVREPCRITWRALAQVYRRLEARGEIRGGRFVSGVSGEQFALPDAVDRLREVRRTPPDDTLLTISAADPLNLHGILTAGERIRAAASNRVVYRSGIAVAVMEGDMLRMLADVDASIAPAVAAAAAGRRVPVTSGYVGRL
jgi:ATP-dependent Lhr-like helicase